eukprot:13874820-Heterocapsa_arctica.AAC.1
MAAKPLDCPRRPPETSSTTPRPSPTTSPPGVPRTLSLHYRRRPLGRPEKLWGSNSVVSMLEFVSAHGILDAAA